MDWFQVLTVIVTNIGFVTAIFLWSRREASCDRRAFESEIRGWKEEINKQMTDFHARLCVIEENRKSI